VELVRSAAANLARPWFAIGGIDARTLPSVVAAGARRIVVVRAVTEAPDAAAAVRELLAGLQQTRSVT
jgi:thiamine-phosphate pyrophosphorylase